MSTSAKRPGLSHPAVIAVVVVLMAAVVVLNVRTFGPRRTERRPAIAAQPSRDGAVPSDLGRILERSAAAGLGSGGSWGDAPAMRRDPFSGAGVPDRQPASTGGPARSTAGPARRDGGLACTAVMLGGRRPVAWIDGRSVGVGDRVRGWLVTAIDADGAKLRNDQGRELILPVDGDEDGKQKYRVVTGQDSR